MKKFFNLYTLAAIAISFIMFNCAGSKTSKVKVDPYIGDWEYVAETPQGSLDVTMTIEKAEEGYTGSLNADMGSVDLEDLKIEDGKMTATYYIESYEMPIKGTFEGGKFSGSTSWDGNEMPINATKKPAAE